MRAGLDKPYDPLEPAEPVDVPIADLLGPRGHEFCGGYRLEPVGDSIDAALDCRSAWVEARRSGREADVPEPRCTEIETFEGGVIQFRFRAKPDYSGYEITSLFPEPPGAWREANDQPILAR